ncbi:DUF5677 domain-containing protein [Halorussus marinus]|uniref:DUF5677 domain-containing protein n=1 Tax=Halorussus marinus TaxID=2505976 RepID=UPI00106E6534|nr:DUF5677 domain-containing protein [Halorussus marinus]
MATDDDPSLQGLIEEKLEEIADELDDDEDVDEVVSDLFDDLVEANYEGLMDHRDTMLEDWREEMNGFEDRLYDDWQEPIDLFESFIVFSLELGQMYSRDRQEAAMDDEDLVHLVLVKLHARACLIAREILALIKQGYADGAHARWRSIHEVAVVGEFLRQTGQETAKRFMLHQAIDDYHQAVAYRNEQDTLRGEPISDETMEELEQRREKLLDHYGSGFDGTWGWASHEIERGRFKDIEEHAGYGQFYPYYKFASKANIHSGAKGTFEQLATSDRYRLSTPTAPANLGFTLPATHAARSLFQITMALLLHRPNEEYMVQLLTAREFLEDIEHAFPEVRATIEQRDEEMWDEYLDEYLSDIEDNLDEFVEEMDDFTPPIVEIDLEDFEVHVGGKDS